MNTRFDNAYACVTQALQETYFLRGKIDIIQASLPKPR
jgi:hypothetical protein